MAKRRRERDSGEERKGESGVDREAEKGEAGAILATITINKPDSLSVVETQMCDCVCVYAHVCVPSGHVEYMW